LLTIKDFRSQYPQYEDLEDEVLTQKLHQKYYSDLDYNEFNSKFNPQQPEEESFYQRNVPDPIKNAVGGIESVGRMMVNFPVSLGAQAAGTYTGLASGENLGEAVASGQEIRPQWQL